MNRRLTMFLLLLLCAFPAMAKTVLEVIPLKSQSAQVIIPALRPLIAPDGTVTGMRNQLILKVDEAKLPEIRRIISSLDRPPRRLIIEVSHGGRQSGNQRGYGLDGRLPITDSTSIQMGNPYGNHLQMNIRQSQTRNRFSGHQRVQGLEGYPALIQSGKRIPVHDFSSTVIGDAIIKQDRLRYQDVISGFYVVPRIYGSEVTLEILQQRQRQPVATRHLDIQRANTMVRGKIGEWISLGSIGETESNTGRGIARTRSTRGSADQTISVRVTALDQ